MATPTETLWVLDSSHEGQTRYPWQVSRCVVPHPQWFNLAAAQRNKDAKARHNRDLLAKKMTPSQIQEAQRLAREFKPEKEDPKQQKNKKYFERLTTFLKWINFCEGGYILEALSEKWG